MRSPHIVHALLYYTIALTIVRVLSFLRLHVLLVKRLRLYNIYETMSWQTVAVFKIDLIHLFMLSDLRRDFQVE